MAQTASTGLAQVGSRLNPPAPTASGLGPVPAVGTSPDARNQKGSIGPTTASRNPPSNHRWREEAGVVPSPAAATSSSTVLSRKCSRA